MTKPQLLMMFVWLKKSFDQAINKHITYKKLQFTFQNRPVFKKIVRKTKCMLRKEITFKRKFTLKVLYFSSTNRNFISLMEGAISIDALILWNEHISQTVIFQQAKTHYHMTKIVRNF